MHTTDRPGIARSKEWIPWKAQLGSPSLLFLFICRNTLGLSNLATYDDKARKLNFPMWIEIDIFYTPTLFATFFTAKSWQLFLSTLVKHHSLTFDRYRSHKQNPTDGNQVKYNLHLIYCWILIFQVFKTELHRIQAIWLGGVLSVCKVATPATITLSVNGLKFMCGSYILSPRSRW